MQIISRRLLHLKGAFSGSIILPPSFVTPWLPSREPNHGRSSCVVTSSAAYVFRTQTRGGDTKRGLPRIELSSAGFKYSGRAIRHETTIHARGCVLYIPRGGGGRMYKPDCPSCIPSRLLGILSPYPLHSLSRRFPLSLTYWRVSPFLQPLLSQFIAASNIHRI